MLVMIDGAKVMTPGRENDRWNLNVLLGCSAGLIVLLFLLGAAGVAAIGRARNVAHYPGATPLTNHSNYSGLPYQFRWDNSYFTTDNFTDVYHWYSTTFHLGAEARANGSCILLEGPNDQIVLERYLSVLLCAAPEGQFIYVTRSTRVKIERN
jgi:hypothetical protein